MSNGKKRPCIFALIIVAGLVLSACAPIATPQVVEKAAPQAEEGTAAVEGEVGSTTEPAAEPETGVEVKRGGTLTIGLRGTPKSLVSIIDPGKAGIAVLHNTQDGLLIYDETYTKILPALAKDFPEIPDPLTYIFHLREGVKFHNGREVTSEDIKYTYDRLLDESYGATYGPLYRTYIDSIETPDKYTVIFHLKQEWPTFVAYAAGNHPKTPNKDLAELPDYGKSVWSGTGPFMIKEWLPGDRVVLTRNPNYWNAGEEQYPYLDEVVYRSIPDASAMFAALESGEIDVMLEPEYKDLARYEDDSRFNVIVNPGTDSTVFVFNTAMEPFKDKRLRQAISLGIDRQEIVDTLFYGYAEVANDFFVSFFWAHDPSIKAPYDPERAKALLKEAGYDESNPFKFTLMPRTEAIFVDQATLIQQQLKEIGVEMEIKPVEYTTLSGMLSGPPEGWEGDAAMYRYSSVRPATYEYTYDQFGAKGGVNRTYYNQEGGYQNPEFEATLLEAMSYSDFDPKQQEEAFPIYSKASKMWLEDAPGLVLNFWANADIVRADVRGWSPALVDLVTVKQVWLDR
jgi:peptide/nickel transport system substrate-binding protein